MELEGLVRSITGLWFEELTIETMITDRHTSINKWIREEMPHTKHYYDVWHVTKGMHNFTMHLSAHVASFGSY